MNQSGPSIVSSISGYITPTYLFLLLNLVIATIALTSRRRHHPQETEPDHHRPAPGPTGLDWVRSIGLFRFGSRDLPQPEPEPEPEPDHTQTHYHNQPPPTALERVKSIGGLFRLGSRDFSQPEPAQPAQAETAEEPEHYDMDHQFRRIQSESDASRPNPAAEERGTLRKLASSLSLRAAEVAEVVRRRPARRVEEEVVVDEEVDARADDFINRFKQQLKLQRLDSIIRYKEMLTRGK